MALLQAINLNKTFFGPTDTQVLFDINFSINQGEFVSIMGASGSGKSTLLHILGFLSRPTSGQYLFNDKNYDQYNEDEAAWVRNQALGFVFQNFNLLPRQTVFDNVRLPLIYSDRPAEEWSQRVRTAVQLVDLTHRLDYETYKLSGGERQRTAIARALINEPQVIFADEPTGNLDSKSGQVVMETFKRLHQDLGHTVILITHESETARYADRLIKIKDGRIESDQPIKK